MVTHIVCKGMTRDTLTISDIRTKEAFKFGLQLRQH